MGHNIYPHGQASLRLSVVTHNFQSTITVPLSYELAYRLYKVDLLTTLGSKSRCSSHSHYRGGIDKSQPFIGCHVPNQGPLRMLSRLEDWGRTLTSHSSEDVHT